MLKGKKQTDDPVQPKPLRLWPGIVALILLLLITFFRRIGMPDALALVMLGGLLFGLIFIVWWVFFSRASKSERWGAVILMIFAMIAVVPFLHESISTGIGVFLFPAILILSLAFVAWAVISRRFRYGLRIVTMVTTVLFAVGLWTLLRTGGLNNEGVWDFSWRWTKTSEEMLLAHGSDEQAALPSIAVIPETEAEWPGFRGPLRDSIIRGVRINNDWSATPPVEMWRRPVGPGWSSFAVHGNMFYTQEQRGEDEVVACHDLTTGEPFWKHRDATRFWESSAGAGPRGTPTLYGGRVYTLGATGILNALDAGNGAVVWSRNAASDTETKIPRWGFSSSPLVIDDIVIVAAAGSLIAYDLTTGDPRWSKPVAGECYSSPHLLNSNGVTQILLQNGTGLVSVTPADGTLLWEHSWPGDPTNVQPAITADGDILISVDERSGIRRIAVTKGTGGWTTEERWTSTRIRPYFNDSVIHNGHVYGFHGPKLACVDISDGTRKWKGGRYGRGQLLLLSDQDLLLVLSDKGEIALVNAAPNQFQELSRFPAINGRTWNHPVLVGDVLLVRNAQEMAAFRLPLIDD